MNSHFHGYRASSFPSRPDDHGHIPQKKLRKDYRHECVLDSGGSKDYPSYNDFEAHKPHIHLVDDLHIHDRGETDGENLTTSRWPDSSDFSGCCRVRPRRYVQEQQLPSPTIPYVKVRDGTLEKRLNRLENDSFISDPGYLEQNYPQYTNAQYRPPTRQTVACGCKNNPHNSHGMSQSGYQRLKMSHQQASSVGNHEMCDIPKHIRRTMTTEPIVHPVRNNMENHLETNNRGKLPQPAISSGLPTAFPKYANFSLGPEYTESLYSTLDDDTCPVSCSSFTLSQSERKPNTRHREPLPLQFLDTYTSTGATVGSTANYDGSNCTDSDEYDDDDTIMSGRRGGLRREGTEITEQHRINSRRSLESALTEVMGKGGDFSQYSTVLLPNKYLGSVLSLRDMTPNAYECDIGFNKLESLRGVPPKTIVCNCSHNKITAAKCYLNELPHLETLDISFNKIGPDLSFLKGCLHLRSINLSHNLLTSLEGIEDSLVPIKYLDLSHNEISGTIDFRALSLVHKKSRGTATTTTTTTTTREFFGWRGVEELNLSHNKIKFMENISALPNLKVLILDNNPIRGIYDRKSCSNHPLRILSLRNTEHRLKSFSFNGARELTMRGLLRFRTEGFQDMASWTSLPPSLIELEITDTFLECLPKWELLPKNLKTLRLEKIRGLKRLPQNFHRLVPTLEKLILPKNQLESCHNLVTVIPHKMLTEIDLRCNPVALKYEMENENDSEASNNGKNLYSLLLRSRKSLRTILLRGEE